MKRTLTVVVLAVCSVAVTGTLLQAKRRTHVSAFQPVGPLSPQLRADGTTPPPPWPWLKTVLVADGTTPPPPWPVPTSMVVRKTVS